MSRPIRAILLLIMIFIAASGMPLYADTMNFKLNFEFPTPFSPAEEAIAIDTNITMLSPSHPRLEFIITANKKNLSLQFDESNPVELSLFLQGNIINTLQPKDVVINHGNPSKLQVDLPQNLLDIPDGNYEIEAKFHLLNIEDEITSDRVAVSFNRKFTYVEALKSINPNETALTLYFPDNNANYLIPITRIIPYTRTPLRSTIDHLTKGPKETLGLGNGSPIPKVLGLGLNRGIANVFLSRDLGIYEEYSSSARIAVESFVNSLTSINEVNAVQFYFDNKILSDGFHGRVMNKPIGPNTSPKLYVGYITDKNRIFLTPISMDSYNMTIDNLFNGLKYSSKQLPYNYSLQPTVPEEVMLLDYVVENGHLQLLLNDAFMTVYADEGDRRKLMVESILYTLTSLEDITSIEFRVEGFTSNASEDLPLNQPTTPSPYINPEE